LAGEIDLDGDFDPGEYEKKMQAIFNDEYYEKEGEDLEVCHTQAHWALQ
jgi:KRI1-like family